VQTETLAARASELRRLHRQGDPLILPNAWDAVTAAAVAASGFPVVASSSAAMSASMGWPDGEGCPVEEMFAALRAIGDATTLPLTADIERGYGLSPEKLVRHLLRAGAVGCNIEDSLPGGQLGDPVEFAAYLAEVRAGATEAGVELVINARTDAFLCLPRASALSETLRRATIYRDAGVDCLFACGCTDEHDIEAVVDGSPLPVNIANVPGGPGVDRLRELGVARISFGAQIQGMLRASLMDLLSSVAARPRLATA